MPVQVTIDMSGCGIKRKVCILVKFIYRVEICGINTRNVSMVFTLFFPCRLNKEVLNFFLHKFCAISLRVHEVFGKPINQLIFIPS